MQQHAVGLPRLFDFYPTSDTSTITACLQMAMPAEKLLIVLLISKLCGANAFKMPKLIYSTTVTFSFSIFHFPRFSPPHPRHPTCQSFPQPKKKDFLLCLYSPSLFSKSDMSKIVCITKT